MLLKFDSAFFIIIIIYSFVLQPFNHLHILISNVFQISFSSGFYEICSAINCTLQCLQGVLRVYIYFLGHCPFALVVTCFLLLVIMVMLLSTECLTSKCLWPSILGLSDYLICFTKLLKYADITSCVRGYTHTPLRAHTYISAGNALFRCSWLYYDILALKNCLIQSFSFSMSCW